MKKTIGFLFFCGFLLLNVACQKDIDIPITQPITENWFFKGKDTLDWQPASVPGNIFSDLLNHKVIPDPFVLNHETKVQWVSKKDWLYQTNFEIPHTILAQDHIEIEFSGLDTYTDIRLNTVSLGATSNAFRSYRYDIKQLLKKENQLKILFKKFDSVEQKKEEKNQYQLPGGKRVYTRKAQFQYGWDWGPVLNTVGIWKPVAIRAWTDAIVRDVYISQDSVLSNRAQLTAELSIESDIEKSAAILVRINKKEIRHKIQLKRGLHQYKVPIEIKDPKLWWTHNLGDPYRYTFDLKFVIENVIKDQKTIKKGIRTIALITEKDSIGESFFFKLNGHPVYMKGANYIPQHSFQNRVTPSDYNSIISSAVEANMNMLRVWGGGIYEDDLFYELCDEKGILVWQDFMFACAMYPGDQEFLKNVAIEAEQQVKRLRKYSSLALWCGNNENSEGWRRWGWQAGRTEEEKKDLWQDYLRLFDSILPNIVQQHSQTDYWESSPKYGRGNPKYKTEGDAHDWWIWHDAYPFEHLKTNVPRFMSEFGFQSFPTAQTINYINQKDTITLQTDAIKSHQKHPRGFELMKTYMERDYHIPEKEEDYAYVSQLLQARGMIMGIEAQRRVKPYNMGTLYWQLNDVWPAISWSSIDYFGHWKALHFKAKKAFSNVLISTTASAYNYDTYIVNDGLTAVSGLLKLKIIGFDGTQIWSNQKEITVSANSSQRVYSIPQANIYKAGQVYIIEFNNSKEYYFFDKPKNLKLPFGKIEKLIYKTVEGYEIRLLSSVFQKDVFLETKVNGRFSDNFFNLEPNVVKKIQFKTDYQGALAIEAKSLNTINH